MRKILADLYGVDRSRQRTEDRGQRSEDSCEIILWERLSSRELEALCAMLSKDKWEIIGL